MTTREIAGLHGTVLNPHAYFKHLFYSPIGLESPSNVYTHSHVTCDALQGDNIVVYKQQGYKKERLHLIMEAINKFAIELDLSGCERVYDYGARVWTEQATSPYEWNYTALNHIHPINLSEDDENSQIQIKMLDKMFGEKGFFEKKAKNKEDSEADSQAGFSKLPQQSRLIPVYKAGDVVKGHVILDLNEAFDADALSIRAIGRAFVKIRVYTGKGYYDDIGKEKYMEDKKVLWNKAKNSDGGDKYALLASDGVLPSSDKLPPGHHRLPFEFQIPEAAPSSCPPLITCYCNRAYLSYRLKAIIDMNKAFKRGNILTTQGLWVENQMDIAANGENLQPLVVDQSFKPGLFMKSGELRCTAKLPARAFIRGQNINLRLEVENQTDTEVTGIKAHVILSGRARAGKGALRASTSITHKSLKQKHVAIPPHTAEICNFTLPLDFHECSIDNNLIPSGNMIDCKLIDMKYEIVLELKRKGLHRNMDVKIPIVIGAINSAQIDG